MLKLGDCIEEIKKLDDNSIDCILTDPPFKYLKGQKLEVDFNEQIFFEQCKRVLKKDGFLVFFGRGSSFYRWNVICENLGFNFKEEIIWDKSHCTSPLMAISRVHETIAIYSKGNGKINRVKVPYLEMKSHDISSIIQDIKRIKTVFSNTKSFDAVKEFLENNHLEFTKTDTQRKYGCTVQEHQGVRDRVASVVNSIQNGMNEKTIIKYETEHKDKFNQNYGKGLKNQNRCSAVVSAIAFGMNEKSIIRPKFETSLLKVVREHYTSIHPTQKPVKLLERLLNLVSKENDLILDPFAGSGSTAIACINSNRKFIGYEIDKEYFENATQRIDEAQKQVKMAI